MRVLTTIDLCNFFLLLFSCCSKKILKGKKILKKELQKVLRITEVMIEFQRQPFKGVQLNTSVCNFTLKSSITGVFLLTLRIFQSFLQNTSVSLFVNFIDKGLY